MNKSQTIWIYLIGSLIFFGVLILFARELITNSLLRQQADKYISISKPPATYLNQNLDYLANISTSQGEFQIDIYEDTVPLNSMNFIYLADKTYYNGVYFHRMIPNLLLQGGDRNTLNSDPNDDGYGKVKYTIADELNWGTLGLSQEKISELEAEGYKNNDQIRSTPLAKYSIVMANNGPNTNSSQFFIVLADDNDTRLKELNGQFTVIGKVISGEAVVEKIKAIPVDDPNSNNPRPTTPIQIISIKIITK